MYLRKTAARPLKALYSTIFTTSSTTCHKVCKALQATTTVQVIICTLAGGRKTPAAQVEYEHQLMVARKTP